MTRKRALLISGTMCIVIGAYIGWCGQQFYLPPPLVVGSDIPPEAAQVIQGWYHDSKGIPPARIEWGRFVKAMAFPYEAGVEPAVIERVCEAQIRILHAGREWAWTWRGTAWEYHFTIQ